MLVLRLQSHLTLGSTNSFNESVPSILVESILILYISDDFIFMCYGNSLLCSLYSLFINPMIAYHPLNMLMSGILWKQNKNWLKLSELWPCSLVITFSIFKLKLDCWHWEDDQHFTKCTSLRRTPQISSIKRKWKTDENSRPQRIPHSSNKHLVYIKTSALGSFPFATSLA